LINLVTEILLTGHFRQLQGFPSSIADIFSATKSVSGRAMFKAHLFGIRAARDAFLSVAIEIPRLT
jgi:hypothetical protein